jgi:hypothetical protein
MQEALHAEHTTHMHPTSYNPLFNILIINIYQSSETGNSTWYVDGVRIYNAYLSTYNYPLEPSGYKTGCQLSSTIVTGHEHEPDHEKVIDQMLSDCKYINNQTRREISSIVALRVR